MLSLFETPITLPPLRDLLSSYLNKGMIPTWEEIARTDLDQDDFNRLIFWPHLEQALKTSGTEYFLHGPETSQWLDQKGQKHHLPLAIKKEDWQLWLEIFSIKFKQNWNVEKPFVSFYGELFGKKYRFSLVHYSTSPNGISKLIIRSIASHSHPLSSFGAETIVQNLMLEKRNILIAGSTGSGKTSLLTSLIDSLKNDEHLVILEDTFEIHSQHTYSTRFLSGNTSETSLKSYLAYSLRLSPDRIILGEIRSHEVVPLLMAMNTGHKGVMATLHASSAYDALYRVSLLFSLYAAEASLSFEKVMELLCRNVEYVVFMENKKVKEVIKVFGSDKGVPFFETITTSYNIFTL